MFVFRSVPVGAVCWLYAAALFAAPPNPKISPPAVVAAPALLQAAVRDVWQNAPEVQAAQAEVEAARARADAASKPLYNPSVSVDAENADVNRRTIGLSLPLDLSGKRRARENQGNAELRASEAAYGLRRRDIAARWLKAWTAAALAARQTELGQRRVKLMQRFDELAAQRLKVGDISSPERDIAALALGESQAQQAALAANEAAARASLRAIGGSGASATPELPPGLPPIATAIRPVATDALPELMQARAERESAEAGVTVARRARIPDPVVSLTGGEVRVGRIRDQVIGLSVSVPLPVFNTGRAEVAAARAEANAASARLRSQKLVLDAWFVEARTRYVASLQAAEAFRSSRAAAFEERAALLEKIWRAGEMSTSDYLVQLRQSLDTALSGLELESQTWQAWFDYLTAAGRLTDWIDGRSQEQSR
ncbi:TolC family protein [Oleiagrimonas sp. MCCC 1A03011]|uniref:TolC family protein n=1 Tax=Oleiagrimonas sp. MCCC 1A03011 TaxID=1926883 RepID=UPI000DD8B51B|nr:TolC family protein [Oleiagrimonas sp. MCCC 1A03011]